MATKTESQGKQALKLTPEQRVDLIGMIWDSLADDELPPISEAEKNELDRRHAEYLKDPAIAVDWEESQRRVDAELSRRHAARTKK